MAHSCSDKCVLIKCVSPGHSAISPYRFSLISSIHIPSRLPLQSHIIQTHPISPRPATPTHTLVTSWPVLPCLWSLPQLVTSWPFLMFLWPLPSLLPLGAGSTACLQVTTLRHWRPPQRLDRELSGWKTAGCGGGGKNVRLCAIRNSAGISSRAKSLSYLHQ